jgi:hypothetical protein
VRAPVRAGELAVHRMSTVSSLGGEAHPDAGGVDGAHRRLRWFLSAACLEGSARACGRTYVAGIKVSIIDSIGLVLCSVLELATDPEAGECERLLEVLAQRCGAPGVRPVELVGELAQSVERERVVL